MSEQNMDVENNIVQLSSDDDNVESDLENKITNKVAQGGSPSSHCKKHKTSASLCNNFRVDKSNCQRRAYGKVRITTSSTAEENNGGCPRMISTCDRERKERELRFACFAAEHGLIDSVEHFSHIVSQYLLTEDDRIRMPPLKTLNIITNVLSPSFRTDLVADLADNYYSLMIDESADEFPVHSLLVLIRYYSASLKTIVTTFYRLLKLDTTDSGHVVELIVNALKSDALSLDKLIGIGAHCDSVIVGADQSVYSELREKQRSLVLLPCTCYSLQLVARKCVNKISMEVEYMLDKIYEWFAESVERWEKFSQTCQTLMNVVPQKLVQPGPLRCMNYLEYVKRVSENWDTLKAYFQEAKLGDNGSRYHSRQLSDMLNDDRNKALLLFLKSMFKDFQTVYATFQTKGVNPFKLMKDFSSLYEILLSRVVVPSVLEGVTTKNLNDFDFELYLLNPCAAYFGYDFMDFVCSLPTDSQNSLKNQCFTCMVEACKQVRRILPESIHEYCLLENLSPENVLSRQAVISGLLDHFECYVTDVCDCYDEFYDLHRIDWANKTDPVEFWSLVKNFRNDSNESCYGNIANFALTFLTLPWPDSTMEPLFSAVNCVTRRLPQKVFNVENVDALLNIEFSLKRAEKTCFNFSITESMLSLIGTAVCNNVDGQTDLFDDSC